MFPRTCCACVACRFHLVFKFGEIQSQRDFSQEGSHFKNPTFKRRGGVEKCKMKCLHIQGHVCLVLFEVPFTVDFILGTFVLVEIFNSYFAPSPREIPPQKRGGGRKTA